MTMIGMTVMMMVMLKIKALTTIGMTVIMVMMVTMMTTIGMTTMT